MQYYQPEIVDAMDRLSHNENFGPSSPGSAVFLPASDRSSSSPSRTSTATAPVIDEELRCRYSNKKCMNPRTEKRTGGLHTFCEEHRENANRNQRRLDQKKRKEKRQHESIQSYYETLQAVAQQEQARAEVQVQPYAIPIPEMPGYFPAAAPAAAVEPYTRPAALLAEDVNVLVSLFGPADLNDSEAAEHQA